MFFLGSLHGPSQVINDDRRFWKLLDIRFQSRRVTGFKMELHRQPQVGSRFPVVCQFRRAKRW